MGAGLGVVFFAGRLQTRQDTSQMNAHLSELNGAQTGLPGRRGLCLQRLRCRVGQSASPIRERRIELWLKRNRKERIWLDEELGGRESFHV